MTHLGGDTEAVADYELGGEFDTEPPRPPENVSVTENEYAVGDMGVEVTGRVANERDEALDYLEAIATLYDGEERVLGDVWTNADDIPAGETRRFSVSWPGRRDDAVAAHRVTLDATL